MKKFSKAIGAILGTATAAGLVALASVFGLELPAGVAEAAAVVLGAAATFLAPANEDATLLERFEDAADYFVERLDDEDDYVGAHRADECADCPVAACSDCPLH